MPKQLLELISAKLAPKSRAWSLSISSGEAWALIGAAASGKSHWLEMVMGHKDPSSGGVRRRGKIVEADIDIGLRATPESVAAVHSTKSQLEARAEVLTLLGLWDLRKTAIPKLTETQRDACRLLPVLLSGAEVLCVDGTLDRLDPWLLGQVIGRLQERCRQGSALICATARPDIAENFSHLALIDKGSPVFAGTIAEFISSSAPAELVVETRDHQCVASIAKPFRVQAESTESGVRLRAAEGQELAARLLVEGYGRVESVLVSERTLGQALAAHRAN